MSFDDLIKFGVLMGKALYDEKQVNSVQNTEEFQKEIQENLEMIEWKDDIELLTEFHNEYASDYGRGIFQIDANNKMDAMFMAYMEAFRARNIIKLELYCYECDRSLGYRMAPKDFESIEYEYELTHGCCSCPCGTCKSWEIHNDFNGESSIYIYKS